MKKLKKLNKFDVYDTPAMYVMDEYNYLKKKGYNVDLKWVNDNDGTWGRLRIILND